MLGGPGRPVPPEVPAARAMPTTNTPRQRLLDAATELFCRLGFHAVGVDAIVAQAGTAKTTLYKVFGSKEALVEAVLEREGRAWRDWFIGAIDAGDATARERLERIVPLLTDWFRQERFYGCPFINAVGEHDKTDDRMRDLALAHKRVVLKRIETLLREAGAADPAGLSHQLGLVIDGAIVAALVTRSATVGETAGPALACLLEANLGARARKAPRIGRVAA